MPGYDPYELTTGDIAADQPEVAYQGLLNRSQLPGGQKRFLQGRFDDIFSQYLGNEYNSLQNRERIKAGTGSPQPAPTPEWTQWLASHPGWTIDSGGYLVEPGGRRAGGDPVNTPNNQPVSFGDYMGQFSFANYIRDLTPSERPGYGQMPRLRWMV